MAPTIQNPESQAQKHLNSKSIFSRDFGRVSLEQQGKLASFTSPAWTTTPPTLTHIMHSTWTRLKLMWKSNQWVFDHLDGHGLTHAIIFCTTVFQEVWGPNKGWQAGLPKIRGEHLTLRGEGRKPENKHVWNGNALQAGFHHGLYGWFLTRLAQHINHCNFLQFFPVSSYKGDNVDDELKMSNHMWLFMPIFMPKWPRVKKNRCKRNRDHCPIIAVNYSKTCQPRILMANTATEGKGHYGGSLDHSPSVGDNYEQGLVTSM